MKFFILFKIIIFFYLFLPLDIFSEENAEKHFRNGMGFSMQYRSPLLFNQSLNISNWQKALNEFKIVVNDYPDFKFADASQKEIGYLYFEIKNYERTINELNKVCQNYSESIYADDCCFQIGFIYFIQKKYERAKIKFYETIKKYGNKQKKGQKDRVPFAYYRLAECYEKLNQKNKANEIYQELIDKYPNHSQAKLAKKRLKKK